MDDTVNRNYRELEVSLLRFFKPYRKKKLLVAVSGGRDSVLLFRILENLSSRLDLQLVIGHVFHGGRIQHRMDAYRFVSNLSDKQNFVSNVLSTDLSTTTGTAIGQDRFGREYPNTSEESMRVFRAKSLVALAHETQSEKIVLAHHRDDLLETRLIRLVRGTGLEGIKSMSQKSRRVLRPFLPFWRDQLEAASKSLEYVEDPTNQDLHYLRNWIRNDWLKQLESYRPGAKKSLAKSLENLSLSAEKVLSQLSLNIDSEGVDRLALVALSNVEQRQILASYLRQKNVKNYSASHIDEVLKRLKTSQKSFQFKVAGRVWRITSHRIRVNDS